MVPGALVATSPSVAGDPNLRQMAKMARPKVHAFSTTRYDALMVLARFS
jgi:hypothetical protein